MNIFYACLKRIKWCWHWRRYA